MDEMLLKILASNIRVPEKTLGDLSAQIASLDIGANEVLRLVGRYGADVFGAAVGEIVDQSERRMRAAIERIPDGVYRAQDWVDGDGIDDEPIRIAVTVTVSGSELEIDFAGSAPQVRGPVNCPSAATESVVFFAVLAMLDPDASVNWGCYRPIRVIAAEGTVVNPTSPAPVVGRNVVAHRVTNVVMSALSDALPDRAVADYYGNSNVYILAFRRPDGRSDLLFDIEVGGWGARLDRDGHDCLSAGTHNVMNTPVELAEQEFPLRVERYELREGSGGAGRFRGGRGVRRVIEVLQEGEFSAQFDRVKFPPPGRDGGGSGAPGRIAVIRDGEERELPGKVLAHRLRAGDRVVLETQGGGGFGDAGEQG
jgi:N-methylhydantoinase B